jgi:hypothetical protein
MNAEQERLRLLRAHAEGWRKEGLIDAPAAAGIEAAVAIPWKSHRLVVQVVFFVLAVIGVATFYGFLAAAGVPGRGFVTGIAVIALAEYLIRERRWFGTGVEAALWLGGVIALITELPRSGTPEALLVLALGVALAGFRVRNPLFGAGAAVLVVAWSEWRFDLGFIVGLAIASGALIALVRTWRRPSTEWLWISFAIVLPVAGWFAAGPEWRETTIAFCAAFALVALALALSRRHHAFFVSAAIGLALAIASIAQALDARPELVFAISGAFLLATSLGASRVLRGRREGFVLTPLRVAVIDDDVMAIGGALGASHATATSAPGAETRPQGDGGFGGAGATGSF